MTILSALQEMFQLKQLNGILKNKDNIKSIMERKHKIESASMVVPMTIAFRKLNDEIVHHVSVLVDYTQEYVSFTGDALPDVDYDDLEQEILAYLRPGCLPIPMIPKNVLDQVAKVRAGEYQSAFNDQLPKDIK